MAAFVSFLLVTIATLVAFPVGILFLEVLAAVALGQKSPTVPINESRRRAAVLVPAHNESTGILPTLSDIKAQLQAGDRLLVVADNCTDDTAGVALAAGAEVSIRSDLKKIGKGYALEWGL